MYLLGTSVKDEGPALLEWVAYHLSIGFDHIIIAYNNCSDGCDKLIEALGKRDDVTAIENILAPDQPPQINAIRKIRQTELFKQATYYMHLDADEFLNIHTGDQSVATLAEVLGNNDVLSVNWASFGPKEENVASPDWVTTRFLHRMSEEKFASKLCKSFIRKPQRFSEIRIHGPSQKKDKSPTYVLRDYGKVIKSGKNASVADVTWSTDFEKRPATYDIAQVNHYITKSMPEFRLRKIRGRGVRKLNSKKEPEIRHSEKHFKRFLKADVLDESIQPKLRKARNQARRLLLSPSVALSYYHCRKIRQKLLKEVGRPWDDREYRM